MSSFLMQPHGPKPRPTVVTVAAIDPQNLEFARAMHDFIPETPRELALRRGDIVAILQKIIR
ncbi:hypothetical protein BC938DRAFT_480604 [Jimgerdemannia flammicorona]|uniref:SH3 domain-containing protein n=1 Tax=Jimgerdemannia flammicorona TaxID=994334 RepID=A0A433QIV5_9FUNG|nr:hypothetical protein BC938DRAFT_480604 [Jimgerdemannia flammicorona]